ncbi:unnamed protein product, partial [Scytosiphon promiscuus]
MDAQGKYEDADAAFLRAIEILEKAFGSNHPDLAICLGSRARVLHAQVRHLCVCKNSRRRFARMSA